ncbi:chromosomal replication initiator DnaA [Bradyrhizobium sp. UFLA05-112]
MAIVKNPVLFSTHFGIGPKVLHDAGLIDPFLNVDTQLFICPVLLGKSANLVIRTEALPAFRAHFENFIRLLVISRAEGDAAWRGARRLLNLREPPENGLGYGGSGRSGNSRPDEIRETILRTSKEIVDLGARDPEMISLMGFFEDRVGPDTISDFTTRVIASQLAKVTEAFCQSQGIPVRKQDELDEYGLPSFHDPAAVEKTVVLVPRDIVRDLPIANDWSQIEAAATANRQIRDRVNRYLAGITRPTVAERKAALRSAATESAELFDSFLQSVKGSAAHYDPNKDALGYFRLKEILATDTTLFKTGQRYDFSAGFSTIVDMVHQTLDLFKHHVEKGNLWEELWIDGVPKRERAAQLIYFAMADSFCKANNIDISPEANMGGGPVDFKFSGGYEARVLVEMKRSHGTVRHGYERQLEIYKEAARTNHGIFVVIDYGDVGDKLNQIRAIREARLKAGEPASEIVVIDATPKQSASKRK